MVSEEKIFEIVDGRRTDGWTPDHGHPISSPCEPNGSGELKMVNFKMAVFSKVKIDSLKVFHKENLSFDSGMDRKICLLGNKFASLARTL